MDKAVHGQSDLLEDGSVNTDAMLAIHRIAEVGVEQSKHLPAPTSLSATSRLTAAPKLTYQYSITPKLTYRC